MLPDRIVQIDHIFEPWNRPDTPGAVLAVLQHGEIVYQRGYGLADLAHRIPNTPQTVYNLASVSKQFTAFAAALLAAEAKLDLDANIRHYLPELPELSFPGSGQAVLTTRHLVHHTAGLRDFWGPLLRAGFRMESFGTDLITYDNAWEITLKQRELNFPPGDQHSYTNMGYLILGKIIARISGASLRQFCQENIFRPLGMTRTQFHDNISEVIPDGARSYQRSAPGADTFIESLNNCAVPGGGDLLSTARDLARWDENFYTGVLGGNDALLIMRSRLRLNDGSLAGYGFGQNHEHYRGQAVEEHGGFTSAFRTQVTRFPDLHTTVILLANVGEIQAKSAANRVADIVLEEHFTEPVEMPWNKPLSVDVLQAWQGTYFNTRQRTVLHISAREGALHGGYLPDKTLPLVVLAPDTVRPHNLDMVRMQRTQPTPEGKKQFLVHVNEEKPFPYVEFELFHPPDEMLAEYPGTYYSPEVDADCRIEQGEEGLVFYERRRPPAPMFPTLRDHFLADLSGGNGMNMLAIEFIRNEDRITALGLYDQRSWRLVYHRQG